MLGITLLSHISQHYFLETKILRFILAVVKVKAKFILEQVQEGPDREHRYSSTLTLTSPLGECLTPRLGGFSPGKVNRCPLYSRFVEPKSWSVGVQKSSTPPRFDSRTIQPFASCYTNYANRVLATI
jgi:hypothetical protein